MEAFCGVLQGILRALGAAESGAVGFARSCEARCTADAQDARDVLAMPIIANAIAATSIVSFRYVFIAVIYHDGFLTRCKS